jgi:hypothetical protein
LTPFIIFLLLATVIICNALGTLAARLVIVVMATSLFVSALSILTKSKTVDLAVAGAMYVNFSMIREKVPRIEQLID